MHSTHLQSFTRTVVNDRSDATWPVIFRHTPHTQTRRERIATINFARITPQFVSLKNTQPSAESIADGVSALVRTLNTGRHIYDIMFMANSRAHCTRRSSRTKYAVYVCRIARKANTGAASERTFEFVYAALVLRARGSPYGIY